MVVSEGEFIAEGHMIQQQFLQNLHNVHAPQSSMVSILLLNPLQIWHSIAALRCLI